MAPRLQDDLTERLITHFVGGAWRSPLGMGCQVVMGAGRVLGQVVCATPADLVRARRLRVPAPNAGPELGRALALAAPALADQMQDLGVGLDVVTLRAVALGLHHPAQADDHIVTVSARTMPDALGRALAAGFAKGVIHAPDSADAVLGVALAQLAQAARLPPGSFTLLHAPVGVVR